MPIFNVFACLQNCFRAYERRSRAQPLSRTLAIPTRKYTWWGEEKHKISPQNVIFISCMPHEMKFSPLPPFPSIFRGTRVWGNYERVMSDRQIREWKEV